jgi:hypothetical protein
MTSPMAGAVLKTVAYADIFDYPLTADEIEKFLIGSSKTEGLKEALTQMTADNKLINADIFYGLPGRERIIKIRQRRRSSSHPKLKKAQRIAAVLRFIPWIRLVGVTGALAMGNCEEDDDIDLMIITAADRLWLTRGLLVTFLRLTGQYRRPGKIKDRICPNLIVSEDALEFGERDLFTAHEIAQMRPIFERGDTYQKFIAANRWVKEFLPNAITSSKFKVQTSKFNSKFKIFADLLDFMERLSYRAQLKYMEGKKTIEVTTPSVIRFHPNDVRQKVLDEYQKRVYHLSK